MNVFRYIIDVIGATQFAFFGKHLEDIGYERAGTFVIFVSLILLWRSICVFRYREWKKHKEASF